ncbi:hypothetical protein MHZ92_14460 [Sporosarcina sp. ACRSL]|uniref:hypothetical protein n=1 Tax=Sporosarcina sp. ACRSL TaxID=2918215 RepID=UPI001EF5AE5C|nr:hypothetical protein [Sporosarcina sp. ACRSL]MCG7345339.1 hypothetical protein [Sporosarcina sp. ACRSL]
MEILAETALRGEYVITIVIMSAAIAFSLIAALVYGILLICERHVGSAIVVGLAVVALVLGTSAIVDVVSKGPTVEYTVLVTDYNEVFAQGYEIVRQEGALTVLTKSGGR